MIHNACSWLDMTRHLDIAQSLLRIYKDPQPMLLVSYKLTGNIPWIHWDSDVFMYM